MVRSEHYSLYSQDVLVSIWVGGIPTLLTMIGWFHDWFVLVQLALLVVSQQCLVVSQRRCPHQQSPWPWSGWRYKSDSMELIPLTKWETTRGKSTGATRELSGSVEHVKILFASWQRYHFWVKDSYEQWQHSESNHQIPWCTGESTQIRTSWMTTISRQNNTPSSLVQWNCWILVTAPSAWNQAALPEVLAAVEVLTLRWRCQMFLVPNAWCEHDSYVMHIYACMHP